MVAPKGSYSLITSIQVVSRQGKSGVFYESKIIHVSPGSELDHLLTEADAAPIELERDGMRYCLSRITTITTEDIWAGYDPEAALAGMRAAAGSWSDIDAETLKEQIYRARDEGSRPPERP